MQCSNDMFRYMLKVEFVIAHKFKSPPSGCLPVDSQF